MPEVCELSDGLTFIAKTCIAKRFLDRIVFASDYNCNIQESINLYIQTMARESGYQTSSSSSSSSAPSFVNPFSPCVCEDEYAYMIDDELAVELEDELQELESYLESLAEFNFDISQQFTYNCSSSSSSSGDSNSSSSSSSSYSSSSSSFSYSSSSSSDSGSSSSYSSSSSSSSSYSSSSSSSSSTSSSGSSSSSSSPPSSSSSV